jgi:hypothetical protein
MLLLHVTDSDAAAVIAREVAVENIVMFVQLRSSFGRILRARLPWER